MKKRYIILILIIAGILPISMSAATKTSSFLGERSLVVASSSPGNSYAFGISIVHTAIVNGDLSAVGGSVITTAPVFGDKFIFAGSAHSRARVGGDFRAIGWSIAIEEPVGGDLVALGYSITNSSRVLGSTFIVAANTTLSAGASGPVTVYGNNVFLSGKFAENVDIVASGRVTIAASTTISGKLSYQAPEPTTIPSSAIILGGIEYSNASYLPDVGTSRILALVSIGFFLFVRIIGALILAGLFAGLFPKLGEAIVERVYIASLRNILLTMLLGFAVFVVTPALFILLTLTFVGFGLAIFLFISYALISLLSIIYASILIGGVFARHYMRRENILWRDGVLGMLTLSIISMIPFVGLPIVFFLTVFSAGALLLIFFNFAFSRDEQESEMS